MLKSYWGRMGYSNRAKAIMYRTKIAQIVLLSILLLFFLQSLSDFIEAIYAFGLLVTAFTIEVASIVLLFTPLLLFFFKIRLPRSGLLGLAFVATLSRLLEPMLNSSGKLVLTGISVGAFLLLFPGLLVHAKPERSWQAGGGLLIALAASIFLRTVNSGLDVSEFGIFQIISWLLALLAGALLWNADLTSQPGTASISSSRSISFFAVGLAAVILMIYFAFASPTVIARWTGFSYTAIVAVLMISLALFAFLLNTQRLTRLLGKPALLVWNAVFVFSVVLTILPHQISFPSNVEAYPLDAAGSSPLAQIPLFLMLILSPILVIDFTLFLRQILAIQPSLQALGGSFALAALFFLVMVFFHVFTTIYDYAPIVGPLFRDRFWFVYLLSGLGMSLPVLVVRKEIFDFERPDTGNLFVSYVVGGLAVLTLAVLLRPVPGPGPHADTTRIRIMTYNIQQGFDVNGNKNLDGQMEVIRDLDPDIVGLQESDTARVANGNVDAVRYFADNLQMYSYYGPTTTTGTFGIALLSRYPIQKPTTFFMYSEGEQTATIQATIRINKETYQVFVTHLGNGGPMRQVEDMLVRLRGLEKVIAMGDFNFRPQTEQYSHMTQTLADSWLVRWPNGKTAAGLSPDERIDYIFVSADIAISESEYVFHAASDHPYLFADIRP